MRDIKILEAYYINVLNSSLNSQKYVYLPEEPLESYYLLLRLVIGIQQFLYFFMDRIYPELFIFLVRKLLFIMILVSTMLL